MKAIYSIVPVVLGLAITYAFTSTGVLDWNLLRKGEKQEHLKLISAYFDSPQLEIQYTISTFANYTTTNIADQEKGHMVISGGRSKTSLSGLVTYVNSPYQVTVIEKEKLIVLADEDKERGKVNQMWQQYLHENSEAFIATDAHESVIKIVFEKNSPCAESWIYFDSNHKPSKVVTYMAHDLPINPLDNKSKREKPRMEFVYTSINSNPQLDESKLAFNHIVSFNNKKATLQKEYSDYKLFDTRINTNN